MAFSEPSRILARRLAGINDQHFAQNMFRPAAWSVHPGVAHLCSAMLKFECVLGVRGNIPVVPDQERMLMPRKLIRVRSGRLLTQRSGGHLFSPIGHRLLGARLKNVGVDGKFLCEYCQCAIKVHHKLPRWVDSGSNRYKRTRLKR